jgi:5-methylcytosine-specific restriction endonuclease McrA
MRRSLRGPRLPLQGPPEPLALGLDAEWRKTRERILARDGYRCTVQVRPGQRCEGTKLLEIHHVDGDSDVLLVPDSELRTVCRRHNPRGA